MAGDSDTSKGLVPGVARVGVGDGALAARQAAKEVGSNEHSYERPPESLG